MHTLTRQTAWAIGLLLVFLGLVGFVSPGFISEHGFLIGFSPDTTRNLLYIAVGAVGIFTLFEGKSFTNLYLMMTGILFTALAVDGFVWNGALFNLFPTIGLDNYFHMFLGCLALVVSIWEMEPASVRRKLFRK